MDSAVLSRRLAPLLGHWSLPVALEWPGGHIGPANPPVLVRMHRLSQLVSLLNGRIGAIGDAYVLGELELEGSLRDIMNAAAELAGDPVIHHAPPLWRRVLRWVRSDRRHQRQQDARQVRFHYDLGNDFFTLWLDPRRVYSCAYFEQPAMALAEAQEAKLEHICRKLQLQPGQRFLDIGAGWGGLLLWAAEHHGVHAHGITLSHDQYAHVQRQIELRGLQGRVQIQLMDYRDLPGEACFDRIASVGMCEHVGSANLDTYFAHLYRLLKPGGLLLNHGITAGGVHGNPLGAGLAEFIETHIFPGGELVHVSQLVRHLSTGGLELLDTENLRPHYARTLWDWSGALERRLNEARTLTTDATLRAYRLYLAGSAMAFERGWLSIHQLLASRPDGNLGTGAMRGAQCVYPFNRAHMYGSPGSIPSWGTGS
jgi:cyclopropane-fatty-acyl-phospholipid synthase